MIYKDQEIIDLCGDETRGANEDMPVLEAVQNTQPRRKRRLAPITRIKLNKKSRKKRLRRSQRHRKNSWKPNEDITLLKARAEEGFKPNWRSIASQLEGRTREECILRYEHLRCNNY